MTARLTDADVKCWAPVAQVTDWLAAQIPEGARVLEIGPGHIPFKRATDFVDIRELPNLPKGKTAICDLMVDPLPYPDKSFDFIYCRHVLEDVFDPFRLCREMSRVGMRGYVETPSPIAEYVRGVDGGSPQWRGYHHHRWLCWHDNGVLKFASKFPIIEYVGDDADSSDDMIAVILRVGALYWNTYHLWEGSINFRHLQCPQDFDITTGYAELLRTAMTESKAASDKFQETLHQQRTARHGL